MADSYDKARDHFVEMMAEIMNIYGMPPMVGRIYGLLAFTPRPMSLDEIAEKLGVAKSGVSTNLRLLEQMGFAEKIWVKGDRKDYWNVDLLVADMFYNFVKDKVSQEFQLGFNAMNECMNLLSDGDISDEHRGEADEIKKRLEISFAMGEDFYRIYDDILKELKALRDKEEELINEKG
jgi:DNA-binding transcriptional regulator GbsR (MarR family)